MPDQIAASSLREVRFLHDSCWIRLPVSAKIALSTADAATAMVGSSRPSSSYC